MPWPCLPFAAQNMPNSQIVDCNETCYQQRPKKPEWRKKQQKHKRHPRQDQRGYGREKGKKLRHGLQNILDWRSSHRRLRGRTRQFTRNLNRGLMGGRICSPLRQKHEGYTCSKFFLDHPGKSKQQVANAGVAPKPRAGALAVGLALL